MFDLVDHYNSGPKSEMVYQMPMTSWHPYYYNVVYSIELDDIHVGDVLLCGATSECTTEHPFNVQVCGYIILAESKHDTKGEVIVPAFGGNVDRNEHHRPFTCTGTIKVEKQGYKYVNFILYVASTAALPNDIIVVEQDYGRLYVLQYRERKND